MGNPQCTQEGVLDHFVTCNGKWIQYYDNSNWWFNHRVIDYSFLRSMTADCMLCHRSREITTVRNPIFTAT